MTQEELSKLTPEEKRIRIAGIMGLRPAIGWSQDCWLGETDDMEVAKRFAPRAIVVKDELKRPTGLYRVPIPDYPGDLNACHEMEKTLTGNEVTRYDNHLHAICGSLQKAIRATASQRCEAFLRAVGKWDDTK